MKIATSLATHMEIDDDTMLDLIGHKRNDEIVIEIQHHLMNDARNFIPSWRNMKIV